MAQDPRSGLLASLLRGGEGVSFLAQSDAQAAVEVLKEDLVQLANLAVVSRLVSGIAHDLINSLTIVMGISERLLLEAQDKSQHTDTLTMFDQAQRTCQAIENLVSVTGRPSSHRQRLDLSEVVRRVLSDLSSRLKNSFVEVVIDLPESLSPTLADRQQMTHLFRNLITNSIQAMETTQGPHTLTVGTWKSDGRVTLTIEDNGPGIAADQLDDVFALFFTTRGGLGNYGLGLSICRSIVEEHGGKITVESQPGRNTAFHVHLASADPLDTKGPNE